MCAEEVKVAQWTRESAYLHMERSGAQSQSPEAAHSCDLGHKA